MSSEFQTPGQLISHILKERGWTQRVLAIVLGLDDATISNLIAGKSPINAEMALTLSEVLGINAEQIMDLQGSYNLAVARVARQPDPAISTRAHLFGELPVAEMIKRGWIKARDARDVSAVEAELARFFGVASPNEIEILPHAAKKTHVATPATAAQLAWLYRVKQIATEMMVGRYSPTAARAVIEKLRPLLHAPEEARKVPRLLTESGIRFVIVESLPGAKIDGVCFWLNDFAPVVGMTTRYDRIDNFWFVLRHELEHVVRRHGRGAAMLDAELEGERAGVGQAIPEEERLANEAAADFCVPKKKLDHLIACKAPFFAERDLIGFSRTLHIHPGLVAGQLQHRTGRNDRFRKHQVKIRSCIAPSAIVDGWGDVAPVED